MATLIICVIMIVACGFFDGQADKISFDFYRSLWVKWPLFFNPKLAFRNKYKQGSMMIYFTDQDGRIHQVRDIDKSKPRFPGSTTVFVWLTDAWHLFKVLSNSCMVAALALVLTELYALDFYLCLGAFFVIKFLNGISFSISYKLK